MAGEKRWNRLEGSDNLNDIAPKFMAHLDARRDEWGDSTIWNGDAVWVDVLYDGPTLDESEHVLLVTDNGWYFKVDTSWMAWRIDLSGSGHPPGTAIWDHEDYESVVATLMGRLLS